MLWKFRYKLRQVQEKIIDAPDYDKAEVTAKDYLARELAYPGVAILPSSLEPLAVNTYAAYLERQKTAGAPPVLSGREASAGAARGGGTVGATDDPTSKPAKSKSAVA